MGALRFLIVMFCLQAVFGTAQAATCTKTSEICVDGPSTKTINGVDVTRSCWSYDAVYQCVEPTIVDNCEPLTQSGCWQHTVPVCVDTAFNGTCLSYENTYRCAEEQIPVPTDVSFLDYEYTITDDSITNDCSANESNPQCTLEAETCVEPGETRNINGLDVTKPCWKWERNYNCAVQNVSECAALDADPTCTMTSTTCVDQYSQSVCGVVDKTYSCTTGSGNTQTITDCTNKTTCLNGYCYSSGSPPDTDFAQSVTWMEISREAGQYQDPTTLKIFNGDMNTCRNKLAASCCKTEDATDKNNAGMYGQYSSQPSITGQVAGNAVRFMGSTYVYDALFSSSLISDQVLTSLFGGTIGGSGSSFAPSVGYYGFTVSYTSSAGFVFAFDPWSLAIQLAIQFIVSITTCDMNQGEQMLALKRGANLCNYVGTWCSNKVLGFCYERKESWCCYNSKLSKLINTQGRSQLGKTYGDPQAPDCSGFTPTELSSLDFSTMDFSEFYADIKPTMIDTNIVQNVAADNVNCKTENGAYINGANTLCDKTISPGVVINTPVVLPY